MRKVLGILSLGLWLGCGQSKAPSVEADLVGEAAGGVTIVADALVYDDTAERVYQVGEAIPFTGKVVWMHENGVLQQETAYRDGREHGPTIWWHEDGSRAGQSMHVNGVLHGPLVQWHPGGTARELQVMYEHGRQVGREIWWHVGGREQSITPYVDGLREGKAMGWFEDGSKSWEATWVKDDPEGRYIEWYPSGLIRSIKTYAQGQQHGPETWYYEHGEKSYEVNWVHGEKQGLLTEWYETGVKMSETPFQADAREGVATGWYENGVKAYATQYHLDEEIAVQEWDETGLEIVLPAGLLREWKKGEIEMFYQGRTQAVLLVAFGKPNVAAANIWEYENIEVAGEMCSVRFTFTGNIVSAIEVQSGGES